MRGRCGLVSLFLLLAVTNRATAQDFAYRGFGEFGATAYPQTSPGDEDRVALEGRVRFEPAYKPAAWLTLSSSLEAQIDNLRQVERAWRVDFGDRRLQRPALSVRQLSATLRNGRVTFDVGKQFVRWGKADILTPTDRFAPRDFLEGTDGDFLAVTGGRLQFERGAHALDLVWVPRFTPSRIPLLNRRWSAIPQNVGSPRFVDRGSLFPHRAQFGARWNVVGSGFEFSLSYFDGFNHLPDIGLQPLSSEPAVAVVRSYAPLRMVGGDGALPLAWFTVKGEAAWLKTRIAEADDVVLYVIQVERQTGELSLVAGYAGEFVTNRRSAFTFAPERGLARAFLGRATYTIDVNRNVALEMAIRQNVRGVWVKTEYSQARGAHWRMTLAGTVIGGRQDDFFGQYRRNSHLLATLRYSF